METPPPGTLADLGLVQPDRLHFVDGLRACAAWFVVLHHAWYTVYADPKTSLSGLANYTIPLKLGQLAVAAFIVISGFSLGLSVRNKVSASTTVDWGKYAVRRARRILPAYWAAIALAVALTLTVIGKPTGTHWDTVLPFHWDSVLADGLLLQDVLQQYGMTINHVLWSVPVEWHLYMVFPLLILLARKVNWITMLVLAVPLSIAGALWDASAHLSGLTLQFLALFAAGTAVSFATKSWHGWSQRRVENARVALSLLVLVGLGVAIGWSIWLGVAMMDNVYVVIALDLIFGAGIVGLIGYLVVTPTSPVKKVLGSPVLAGLGYFSYSVYLVHAPLLQIVWQVVVAPFHLTGLHALAVVIVVGLPTVCIAAYGFHRLFERPFMRPGPKLRNGSKVEAAA